MALELQPGETSLGEWTVHDQSPGKRATTGTLSVTNFRVVFAAQTGGGGALRQARQMGSGAWRANNSISIKRDEVAGFDAQKGFFAKKVLLKLTDGRTFVFNRGMMSVDPIIAALQQR